MGGRLIDPAAPRKREATNGATHSRHPRRASPPPLTPAYQGGDRNVARDRASAPRRALFITPALRRIDLALILAVSLSLGTARAPAFDSPPAAPGSGTAKSPANSPLGFTTKSRDAQLKAEANALAVPTPENARRLLATLTREPHVAGTPADYKTAVFVRDKLREWGWKAEIAEFEVLLNYPTNDGAPTHLQLTKPAQRAFSLDEVPVSNDKDSASSSAFGAFHGYGASGSADGQVVYANYGRPEDYTALDKIGIDVKGKVVLVRYGGNFRGLKVYNAQKRGAAGILIFSDPADDGFAKGDVYPDGRFRPASAIQRGSVQFLSHGPGDPSTPFGPSIAEAKRLPIDRRSGISESSGWQKEMGVKFEDYYATIPSLPLSYETAHDILKVLAGPNVPTGWQGGLPLAYHVGPGPAEVSLSITMDYKLRKIWNVIATIPGTVEPDRWVLIGNHRDAWVYGAVDPGSGTAATLEMCRAIGSAVKSGWKPRRTLYYASWDAEEYGLVGSTEWAEAHAKPLGERAVLLLNVDSAVSGRELEAGGVPSLRDLMLDAAASLSDPRSGRTLGSIWTEARRTAWATSAPLVLADPVWDHPDSDITRSIAHESPKRNSGGFVPQMGWLGSGSDYTVFVDHLGIPAFDMGFKGGYGVYHSIFDNFNWMEKFGDPEFLSHATAARLYTVLVMRASAAEILPFKFVPYGLALRQHVDDLRLIQAQRSRKADPAKERIDPEIKGIDPLIRVVREFLSRAEALDRATDALQSGGEIKADGLKELNDALARVERAFLLDKGLPGRPWFKHAIYAPGLTTGYGSWPLPAIRQALEDNDARQLESSLTLTTERIAKATASLEAAYRIARGLGNGPDGVVQK
jgi:N-acetylated-alpha-linked acidic dipeptidase